MLCVFSKGRMSSRRWVLWVWIWVMIEGRRDEALRLRTAKWMRSVLLAILSSICCSAIVYLCSMQYYAYKCSCGIALAPARTHRSMQAHRRVL